MPNAKNYKPKSRLISVAGGPGTGKSTFILSASKVGKLAVALSPQAELDTYAGHDVEYDIFVDEGWQPFKEKYEASAYNRLMKWLDNIDKRKDIGIVGVDAMSAVSDLIMHEATKMNKTDNPMDIEGFNLTQYICHLVAVKPFGGTFPATTEIRQPISDPQSIAVVPLHDAVFIARH